MFSVDGRVHCHDKRDGWDLRCGPIVPSMRKLNGPRDAEQRVVNGRPISRTLSRPNVKPDTSS